ncbi:MAG TPA: YtxH domain-containing protein [bacterium]|jgi:gas vesicle protein
MSQHDEYRGDASDALRWLAAGMGLGMLFGAALGMLLAPKSGRETREQLKGIATELGDKAKTVASDLGERATTTYGTVREKTKVYADEISSKAKTTAKDLGDKIVTGKEAASEAIAAAKKGYQTKVEELAGTDGESD